MSGVAHDTHWNPTYRCQQEDEEVDDRERWEDEKIIDVKSSMHGR